MTVSDIYNAMTHGHSNGIIKDKDIISDGDLSAPREFFLKLHAIRLGLIRIEAECDAHASDIATKALKLLDEAFEVGRG